MDRATLWVVMAVGGLVAGCNAPRHHYVSARTDQRIVIDGRLDEPAWRAAARTEPFVNILGARHPVPRDATCVRMCWDNQYLYVGAELQDSHVWATLTERDAIIYRDNAFEVFVDPDGDTRDYCEIEVNALNTIFDLFLERTYAEGGPALPDWNMPGLVSAVHVAGTLNDPRDEDTGWTVEMALPWRAFERAGGPVPPRPGDVWRMNFARVAWPHRVVAGRYEKQPDTRADISVWSPQGEVNMHLPRQWGFVRFAE